MNLTVNNFKNINWYVFPEARTFNNEDLETVVPSPKNNNPNISASF